MYVAITRARKRLYLSFSQTRMLHGQTRYNVRSRFLEELPEGPLKWLTPRNGVARGGWGGGHGDWAAGGGGWNGGARSGGEPRSREQPSWSQPGRSSALGGDLMPASDRRLAGKFDRGLPWRMGQTVAHAKFGEGVILNIEGSGTDARVQVNFGKHGVKWLALSIAKLDAVN